jgi:hypothetical protein
VIGANPLNPGWTLRAYIPAIQALPDYALSRRQYEPTRISRYSGQAFGVAAFGNAQKDLGTLERGTLADIVAVAGDPVPHSSVLRRIAWVMTGGKLCRDERK